MFSALSASTRNKKKYMDALKHQCCSADRPILVAIQPCWYLKNAAELLLKGLSTKI
jgi:hypothetical protein